MLTTKILILHALDKKLAISDLNYTQIMLITLIMGQLTAGGQWQWFHSISRARKPYHSYQNVCSKCHRKKVT
jgi:hypothetical protein